MTRLSLGRVGLIALCCLATRSVYAAPPYRTDDPEPTEFGHFELYTFSNGTVVRGDTAGTLPGIELNYGLIPNGQLTIDTVAAFDSPSSGPVQFGYGDCQGRDAISLFQQNGTLQRDEYSKLQGSLSLVIDTTTGMVRVGPQDAPWVVVQEDEGGNPRSVNDTLLVLRTVPASGTEFFIHYYKE